MYSTTINIREDLLEKIKIYSLLTDLNESGIIKWFFMKILEKESGYVYQIGTVNYQEQSTHFKYKKKYIEYTQNEYDAFTDFRKTMKMSVSRVLFLSFSLFSWLFEKTFCNKHTNRSSCLNKTYNYIPPRYDYKYLHTEGVRKLFLTTHW